MNPNRTSKSLPTSVSRLLFWLSYCVAAFAMGMYVASTENFMRAALLAGRDVICAVLSCDRGAGSGAAGGDWTDMQYVARYPNGDVLSTYANGVSRIDKSGQRLWQRRDGSHHEPYVGPGDTAWVASAQLEDPFRSGFRRHSACNSAAVSLDVVTVLDGDGTVVRQWSLSDAFVASPWKLMLRRREGTCNPFGLNAVAAMGDDTSGLVGVAPGDIVLSLGLLDAFAIMDKETGRLHRVVRGTFQAQYSVKHLGGSKFILADGRNVAGDFSTGTEQNMHSRILVVDAATGWETTVFPRDMEHYGGWRTARWGRLSLSPDKARVIASYPLIGKAVEVRIADGEVLAEFDDLRDVEGIEEFAGRSDVVHGDNSVLYAGERHGR